MDFIRENILNAADMLETRDDNFFAVIQNRTRFYQKSKSEIVQNAGVLDSSYKIPGGGMLSSADDLAHFEAAMLADKLVKPATRELLWTSQKTPDGRETGYGLGWGVNHKFFDAFTVGHGGAQQGTSTFIMLIPARRAGVVVLANMENLDTGFLARQILKIAFDLPGSAD